MDSEKMRTSKRTPKEIDFHLIIMLKYYIIHTEVQKQSRTVTILKVLNTVGYYSPLFCTHTHTPKSA